MLEAGYLDDALDEALELDRSFGRLAPTPAAAAAIIVFAATRLATQDPHSSRFDKPALAELVERHVPELLADGTEASLAIAAFGARIGSSTLRRRTRETLKAQPGTRRHRASLALWVAGRRTRRLRWPLFALGVALVVAINAFNLPDFVIVLTAWSFLGWCATFLVATPLRVASSATFPRDDPMATVRPSPPGEQAGSPVITTRVDRYVRRRRAIAFGQVLAIMVLPATVILGIVTTVVVAVTVLGRGPSWTIVVPVGFWLVVVVGWRARPVVTRAVAAALMPAAVRPRRYPFVWTTLGASLSDSRALRAQRAWAEGRHVQDRLRRRWGRPCITARTLFLRSFGDDGPVRSGQVTALMCTQFACKNWIEILAVPDERRVEPMAGVVVSPAPEGQHWLEHVAATAGDVDLVTVGLGPTAGLGAELDLIRDRGLVDKTVLVVPFGRRLRWDEVSSYLDRLGLPVGQVPDSEHPLAIVPGEPAHVFTSSGALPSFARSVCATEFACRLVLERRAAQDQARA